MMTNDRLRSYLEGFWATWLLHVGRELGLFSALKDEALTPDQLAEKRGYEPVYTGVWCRAAKVFEFLTGDDEQGYRLPPGWEQLLLTTGAWATTYVQVSQRVYESMEAVFLGKAFPEPSLSLRMLLGEGLKTSYNWLWRDAAPAVPELVQHLEGQGRLIEFGCGTGCGLELLKAIHPQLELTGIEQDYDCAREAERATKAVIVVGTAEGCRYQGRFDVAVFHRSLSQCEDPAVAIERAGASLKDDGLLVISTEAEIPELATAHRSQIARLRMGEQFFYQMFLAQDAMRVLTAAEIRGWCEAQGLKLVRFIEAPDHGSPTLVYLKPA